MFLLALILFEEPMGCVGFLLYLSDSVWAVEVGIERSRNKTEWEWEGKKSLERFSYG